MGQFGEWRRYHPNVLVRFFLFLLVPTTTALIRPLIRPLLRPLIRPLLHPRALGGASGVFIVGRPPFRESSATVSAELAGDVKTKGDGAAADCCSTYRPLMMMMTTAAAAAAVSRRARMEKRKGTVLGGEAAGVGVGQTLDSFSGTARTEHGV